ncbi:MAG: alpha/beta hydrolase [Corynebacterium sp.]|nr:alpha/beta hydrolase [Corynebacterium sp.]
MHTRNETIPAASGNQLAASIDTPSDGEPAAYAIFSHFFTGNKQTPAAKRISKRLTEHGYGVVRFDYPGLGASSGDLKDQTFTSNVLDLISVTDWMGEHLSAPQLMVGHSLGGAAVLRAASEFSDRLGSLAAIATLGAPFDPAHAVYQFHDHIDAIDEHGELTFELVGRTMTLGRPLLDDLANTNPETYLPHLHTPLLILHSPVDTTVGISSAQLIFQLTRYPKSLICLDGIDHLATKPGAGAYIGDLIATWASAYITPVPAT